VQSRKFSELLQDSLTRYRNRAIETAQVIEELIAMAKQFKAAANRGEELGLSRDEMAFYDALAANEASVRELGDATLRKIARELTEKLRASNSVDWYVRESVRAKLRLMVKTILKKYKYPPEWAGTGDGDGTGAGEGAFGGLGDSIEIWSFGISNSPAVGEIQN